MPARRDHNGRMIRALALLLACQLTGEIVARALGAPVPGPVIGLALLAVGILIHARATGADPSKIEMTELGRTAGALLGSLGLLFVPAGVGVVQNLDLLAQRGVAIALVLAASVVVTLLVTAGTFLVINRLLARRRQSS